jgi:hypothetical protein
MSPKCADTALRCAICRLPYTLLDPGQMWRQGLTGLCSEVMGGRLGRGGWLHSAPPLDNVTSEGCMHSRACWSGMWVGGCGGVGVCGGGGGAGRKISTKNPDGWGLRRGGHNLPWTRAQPKEGQPLVVSVVCLQPGLCPSTRGSGTLQYQLLHGAGGPGAAAASAS